jgi:hypothetical protein
MVAKRKYDSARFLRISLLAEFFFIFTHMLGFRYVVCYFRLYRIGIFFIFDKFATFARDVIQPGIKCRPLMQCCGSGSKSGSGSTGSTCFWPPGSGSTSQRYESGSGSFYHHAKILRKT